MTAQTLNRFEWLKAVLQVDGLSGTAKALASALAVQFFNDDTGQLNPSQKTLADFLKVHEDTVKRLLRELRNAGWLVSIGDGGRGKAPKLRLLSPSKIIPFRPAKGGRIAPQSAPERGADMHPKAEKRGADLQEKGGGNIPRHYKEEQYKEQRARPWKAFSNHRFPGNCTDGVMYLDKSKHYHELTAWSDWLRSQGFPDLCALPIRVETGKATLFALPFRKVPEGEEQTKAALAYFTTLLDAEGTRHAAQ